MTTAAQVKKLLRPLLERNTDTTLVGRRLVLKPLTHILRSAFIDSSSNKDRFTPTWEVNMMFERDSSGGPTWGREIYPTFNGNWLLTRPGISEATCERIEEIALPILRSVASIDDFVAFTTKERFPSTWLDAFPFRRIYADIALGDLKAANESCERVAKERERSDYIAEILDPIIHDIWPLVRKRDKAALAKMLHQWEAEAAKRMKLEHIWEPTPFPLELN
jgi:hypothetical protein